MCNPRSPLQIDYLNKSLCVGSTFATGVIDCFSSFNVHVIKEQEVIRSFYSYN